MRKRILAACAGVVLLLAAASCSPPARHAALTLFFDGVPPLPSHPVAGEAPAPATVQKKRHFGEHGPYGARLCSSCHESTAGNTFVAPRDKLCVQCHDMGPEKKFQHDPAASGECMSCHDPHDSAYPSLLIAAPNKVCAECHEQEVLPEDPAHTDATQVCTSCHDPHQSDKENLLR